MHKAHALLNALRFTVYPGAPSVLVTDRRFTGTSHGSPKDHYVNRSVR